MAQLHKEEEKTDLQTPAQLHDDKKGKGHEHGHKPNIFTKMVDTIKNKHYEHQQKKEEAKSHAAEEGEGEKENDGSCPLENLVKNLDLKDKDISDQPAAEGAGISGGGLEKTSSSPTVGDIKPALFDTVMQPEAIDPKSFGSSHEVESRVPPPVPEESHLTPSFPAGAAKGESLAGALDPVVQPGESSYAGALDPVVQPGESSYASALNPLVQTGSGKDSSVLGKTEESTVPVAAEAQHGTFQGGYLPTSVTNTASKAYEQAAGVASYLWSGNKGAAGDVHAEAGQNQASRDLNLETGTAEKHAEGAKTPTTAQRTYEQVTGTATYLKDAAAARLGYGTGSKKGKDGEATVDEGAAEISEVLAQPPFVDEKHEAKGYYGSVVDTVKAVRNRAATNLGYAPTDESTESKTYLKDLQEEDRDAKLVLEGGGHMATENFEEDMHDRFKLGEGGIPAPPLGPDEGAAKISDVLAQPPFAEERHEAAAPKGVFGGFAEKMQEAAGKLGLAPKADKESVEKDAEIDAKVVSEGGGHIGTEAFEDDMHDRFKLGETAPDNVGKEGTLWQQPK
eukprot:TRINITY_DN2708_c0_g1_i1.p1 TRINITY_DN2708_c0_g1~~TRINITY_DN2708_c0_g1_i1.p1  ORF type:complete len:565 (-),score=138.74 TRINITY_DN2708_c0_g1_i1:557-2251(-)